MYLGHGVETGGGGRREGHGSLQGSGVESAVVSPLPSPLGRIGQSRDGGGVPGDEDSVHEAHGRPGAGMWEAAKEPELENKCLLFVLTDLDLFHSAREA